VLEDPAILLENVYNRTRLELYCEISVVLAMGRELLQATEREPTYVVQARKSKLAILEAFVHERSWNSTGREVAQKDNAKLYPAFPLNLFADEAQLMGERKVGRMLNEHHVGI
jgi:hypothetical protein